MPYGKFRVSDKDRNHEKHGNVLQTRTKLLKSKEQREVDMKFIILPLYIKLKDYPTILIS